jgi:hypothetical protein
MQILLSMHYHPKHDIFRVLQEQCWKNDIEKPKSMQKLTFTCRLHILVYMAVLAYGIPTNGESFAKSRTKYVSTTCRQTTQIVRFAANSIRLLLPINIVSSIT